MEPELEMMFLFNKFVLKVVILMMLRQHQETIPDSSMTQRKTKTMTKMVSRIAMMIRMIRIFIAPAEFVSMRNQ